MLGSTLATLFTVASIASSQSCIRNEVRAALEEIGNQSSQGFIPPIQSTDTADVHLQEINSTMLQGFQSVSEELQIFDSNSLQF